HVLCLAPTDGVLPLPGSDNALPAPGHMSFHRRDIITSLDKRLDANAWGPAATAFSRSMKIKADEGKVVAEFAADAEGWPWIQIDFPDKKGRLIVCCFALVEHWNSGPTPRFLFARALERLTEPLAVKLKD